MKRRDGLLPRMEARAFKDGSGASYRYHPVGGKPIPLGTDRQAAVRKVLDLLGRADDTGTVGELWRNYENSADWRNLAERTQADYRACSVHVLQVFGQVHAATIRPADIARYLRVERGAAPVRANREVALLSNLLNLAVERGDIERNPCREVRRNKEQPRTTAPSESEIEAFARWIESRHRVIGLMAEFCAFTGARRCEFLKMATTQIKDDAIRLRRAKQRGKEIVDVVERAPHLDELIARIMALPRPENNIVAFPTRAGRPYTEEGFKSMWSRLMAEAMAAGVVERRFTFHDLRAAYTTIYRGKHDRLPNLHRNPETTARVYDRSKEQRRKAL